MNIPVVCVVLDGGPGTLNVSNYYLLSLSFYSSLSSLSILSLLPSLSFSSHVSCLYLSILPDPDCYPLCPSQTILNVMLNATPCVVLEGSGRLADVISQAAGLPPSRVTLAFIHQLMKRFFSSEYDNFSELEIVHWTKKVTLHMQQSESHLNIFNLFIP